MDAILAGWLLASTPTMALTYSVPAHIPTSAGDVSGTITTKGAPIGPGVRLEIRCGAAVYSAVTDSLGHYRVYVSQTGRCTLGLTYQGQALAAEVYSYDTPVRYDWSIETGGGAYRLRRM